LSRINDIWICDYKFFRALVINCIFIYIVINVYFSLFFISMIIRIIVVKLTPKEWITKEKKKKKKKYKL
jgi:hypothetical protein